MKNAPLTGNTINKIIDDENDIKYWQLECFAAYAGVPTFLILMMSRIISDINDTNSDNSFDRERATESLASIKLFIRDSNLLISKIDQKDVDIDDIHQWIENYSNIPPLLKNMEKM